MNWSTRHDWLLIAFVAAVAAALMCTSGCGVFWGQNVPPERAYINAEKTVTALWGATVEAYNAGLLTDEQMRRAVGAATVAERGLAAWADALARDEEAETAIEKVRMAIAALRSVLVDVGGADSGDDDDEESEGEGA